VNKLSSPVTCLRILLAAILLVSIFAAIRQGLAAWQFRKGDPSHVQAAIKFDPHNPEYYARLGWLMHFYSEGTKSQEIAALYQRATQLSPSDAQYWSDLGSALDWAGEPERAMQAFNRALELFPNSPDLEWKLANFRIREGDLKGALGLLKKVLLSRTMPSRQVFALAQRASPDTNQVIHDMLPDSRSLLDFLYYELNIKNPDGAAEAWNALLRSKCEFTLMQSFPYLDTLIDWRDSPSVLNVWSTLQRKFPDQISPRVPSGNLITNGDFSRPLLNDGLDWRVTPIKGITIARDKSFLGDVGRSLRLAFAGSRNAESSIVFQTVPVNPDTDYHFSVRMRLDNIPIDGVLKFQILDPNDTSKLFVSTEGLAGTIADVEQHLEFRTPSSTKLVVLTLSQAATQASDGNTGSAAWIERVRLWTDGRSPA
jgi:hypothetical protein